MQYNNKVLLGLLLAVVLLVGFGFHSFAQATYKHSTAESNNLETADTTPDFVAVEMLSNSSGWAVGRTGEFYYLSSMQNNVSVWDFKQALGEDIQVTDISFVSPTSGWAVGAKPASGTETNGAIWHYDGTSWQQTPSATMGILYGIDMLSDWEGWAVGEMRVLRYISFTWTIDDLITPYGPVDVDAVSSNNVWVTGWPGVYHNNGNGWQATQPTSWFGGGPTSIDMLSANSGWGVRYGGKIYRYNGTSWSEVASPTTNALSDIHMVSATEGWAVGDLGTILRYNGSNWQTVASPTTENLNAIFMWSNTRGTAVGDNGTILGYNNGIWSIDSLRIPPTCAGLSFIGNPLNGGNYSKSPEPDCPDNNFKYKSDTVITLTALPARGYKFASWSGAITSTENPTTIILGDRDRSITINFDQLPCYTINYGSNNPLWGSVRIDWSENKTQQKYLCPPGHDESRWQANSRVWLNAVPNTGYRLKTWQRMDTLPNPENTTPVYIDMYKDRSITAIFEQTHKIDGFVTDSQTGVAILGAQVHISDNTTTLSSDETDEDGHYEFNALPAGGYQLAVSHQDYYVTGSGPHDVPPSRQINFSLQQHNIDDELNPDITIGPEGIEFEEEYPYLPDKFILTTSIRNKGKGIANKIILKFYEGDPDDGGIQIGHEHIINNLSPTAVSTIKQEWDLKNQNRENASIFVITELEGQLDNDISDNKKDKKISVYLTDFQLNRDAYSFPNRGLTWADFERDFDKMIDAAEAGNVFKTTAKMVLLPFLAAYVGIEKSGITAGGQCYGYSATSSLYQRMALEKPFSGDTYEVDENGSAFDMIRNYQLRQYPYVLEAILKLYDIESEYSALVNGIKNEHKPMVLFLVSFDELLNTIPHPSSGHAVVAYKILDMGEEKRVYVYDSNFPLNYLKALESKGLYATFYTQSRNFTYFPYPRNPSLENYSFSWFMARDPLTNALKENSEWLTGLLREMYDSAINSLANENLKQVFVGSPVDVLLTDNQGRKLGVVDGNFYDEIPGSKMFNVLDKKIFYIPDNIVVALSTVGTGSGSMTIQVVDPTENEGVTITRFIDVPVDNGSVSSLQIVNDGTKPILLLNKQDEISPDIFQNLPLSEELMLNMLYLPYTVK